MTHWKEKAREIYKGIMVRCGQGYPAPTGKAFVRLFAKFLKRGDGVKELLDSITTEEKQAWFEIGLKLKIKAQYKAEIKALESVVKRLRSAKDNKHFFSMFKLPEWNHYFAEGRAFGGLHNSPDHLGIALMSTIEATKNALEHMGKFATVKEFFEETKRRAEASKKVMEDAGREMTVEEQAELSAIFRMVDPNDPALVRPDGTSVDAPIKIHGPQPEQPPSDLPVIIAEQLPKP